MSCTKNCKETGMILELTKNGCSQREICRRLGIGDSRRVRNTLSNHGIQTSYASHTDNMKELYESGMPVLKIVQKTGKNSKDLWYLVKRYDLRQPDHPMNFEDTQDEVKNYIDHYGIDNPGISKAFQLQDPRFYRSILHHTRDHNLSTDKITERAFRIWKNLGPEQQVCKCGKASIFYTLVKGYGYSETPMCRRCCHTQVSKISQQMFWEVYNQLTPQEQAKCFFGELNHERAIRTDNADGKLELINKHSYRLDFTLDHKCVEFDGYYWHRNSKKKDEAQDLYLKEEHGINTLRVCEMDYRNYPEETVQRVIDYLRK